MDSNPGSGVISIANDIQTLPYQYPVQTAAYGGTETRPINTAVAALLLV